MVRKSNKDINKWNYPIEKGTELIHKNMLQILKEKESDLEIHELIHLLNLRTKKCNFKLYGKRKAISSYIDYYYRNIVNFAESFIIYNVVYKNKKVYIKLNEEIDISEREAKKIKRRESDECWSWDIIDVPSVLELS